jgi:hypothetical protein
MKFTICHESNDGIRIHMAVARMSIREADLLDYYLRAQDGVRDVKVYERTGNAVIRYEKNKKDREQLFAALCNFSYTDEAILEMVPENTGRALNRAYQERLVIILAGRCINKLFFPMLLQIVWTVVKSLRFLVRGLRCLLHGRIEVPLLDATAITASMLRRDFGTASSVMFLLELGELLEEWTHKKSVGDLARAMSLKVDKVWMKTAGEDVLMDVRDIRAGDRIALRTSDIIPLDGVVVEGEMTVNQSSMTGESVPVRRAKGGYVYAGTVVEEGECVIEVKKAAGSGRYDTIVRMIEESEKLKSNTEARAYHLADGLVPYSLGGALLTGLLTGNITKALSFLMVDFSCALKLSIPLSVLSAIREAGEYNISVKGGKFLEAVAAADTIVFDKTGTLTCATPQVVRIETFDGFDERAALKISACLEEHYPHSIANAVVAEAKRRNIRHDEMHSKVQYVVAHGISSLIEEKKAIIGSYHFVFEDEGCQVNEEERERMEQLPDSCSHLYLAIDGRLKAVLCIFDPLREEAPEIIKELRALGITKICMMTGDNKHTAAAVAEALDLDAYAAEVLPQDKALFIQKEHAAGRKVIMVGDGVNDTPALSEADAGVAISDGAAIAREVADITIASADLYQLITLRKIATALMKRIDRNYHFIISFNAMLIVFGLTGVLPPAASALIHNTSTVVTGLKSMTDLLPAE